MFDITKKVGGDDDCCSKLVDAFDEVEDVASKERIKVFGGFVEDEKFWVMN